MILYHIRYNEVLRVFYKAFFWFFLFVTAYAVILILFWTTYPYKTATVTEPIRVTNPNKEVSQSGEIKLELLINKQSNYVPIVNRSIVCADRTYLVTVSSGMSIVRPKGVFIANVHYAMPNEIPIGESCYFIYRNDYQVNSIRTITNIWKSETFKVIE